MKKLISTVIAICLMLSSLVFSSSATTPSMPNRTGDNEFSWGVNGHIASDVYIESNISYIEQMAYAAKLGAKVYRVNCSSTTFLPQLNKIVKAANSYGMDVMLVFDGISETSTPEGVAAEIGKLARHFATGQFGTIKYIQIGTEPELKARQEGKDGCSASDYDDAKVTAFADIVKAATSVIRAASSDYITVVNYTWLHEVFLDLIRQKGADFDVIGIDWYGAMQGFDNGTITLNSAVARLNNYNSLNGKKVIVCESNDTSPAADNTTLSGTLREIMEQAYNNSRVIGLYFYELFDEFDHSNSNEREYGLVDFDDTKTGSDRYTVKEKYTTIQNLIGGSDSIVPTNVTPQGYPTNNPTYTVAKNINTDYVGHNAFSINLNESIDMFDSSQYSVFEFDVYAESTASGVATYNVVVGNGNGGIRRKTISVTPNEWHHICISTDSFTNYGTGNIDVNITFIGADGFNNADLVNMVNICLTNLSIPNANYTYNVAKTLPSHLEVSTAGKTKPFGETVNLTQYDYLEFDICTTGTPLSNGSVQILGVSNGSFIHRDISNVSTEWTHVVLDTKSGWGSWGNAVTTAVSGIGVNNPQSGTVYHIANIALTNFAPDANYTYNVANTIPGTFTKTGGTSVWTNQILFGKTVDLTAYDYLEFDVLYTGDAANNNIQLQFNSSTGTGYSSQRISFTKSWQHIIIPKSTWVTWGGDMTKATAFMLNNTSDGNTYYIANMAFTNFVPEANYTYNVANTIPGTFTKTGGTSVWTNQILFGKTVDLTAYDYLEFDVLYTGDAANNNIQLQFNSSAGTGYSAQNISFTKSWQHIIIPKSTWVTWGGDMTKATAFMLNNTSDGNTYYIANIAFTNENSVPEEVWGDANGDGQVNISDLVSLRKLIAAAEWTELLDFNEDGVLDAEDLINMRKFLLGIIPSLNPAEIE